MDNDNDYGSRNHFYFFYYCRFAIQYIAELEDVLQIEPPSPDPDYYQSVSYNPAMLINPNAQFPVPNQTQVCFIQIFLVYPPIVCLFNYFAVINFAS